MVAKPKPRRILITAGPTHEPIDAVRYLANRSSGKLGVALAQAALEAGWEVALLLGPVSLHPPAGVATERFTTTADLQRLLADYFPLCDVLVMAAAVADYRPASYSDTKRPRTERGLTLSLEATPDLVAACAAGKRPDQKIVAFALENSDLLEQRAGEKLRRKGVDAIVANSLKTMSAEDIEATLLLADGQKICPGPLSKSAFARWLIAWLNSWA